MNLSYLFQMKSIFLCIFLSLFLKAETRQDALPLPSVTISIPMADGTGLPTDLYFPKGQDPGSIPCILMRNPSGKRSLLWLSLLELVSHNYVMAIQDTRSALDPEGKTLPYFADGWGGLQDGYDTIEWLAKSKYCNGKIGTIGFSAVGITQNFLAPTAPSSLKCQYIGQAASSMYHHVVFPGGQLQKHQVESWLRFNAPDAGVMAFIVGQPFYNEFWKKFDMTAVADKIQAPAVHYVGWYDTFLQGTIDGFLARQENGGQGAKGRQKLLIGPWTHSWPHQKVFGDFEIPKQAENPPIDLSPKSWFDYYLKDVDNGIPNTPPITYYVMGPFDGSPSSGNVWKYSERWPIPAKETPFYLCENSRLSPDSTSNSLNSLSYVYDPENPVPTVGGRNLFLEQGPKDQRPIESRSDTILFTTDPLRNDLEVTGRVKVKLWIASDACDTDIVVRLTDVYPDGKSILIADGICRTGMVLLQSLEKKNIQEIEVDLFSTSMVFAKGHKIRLAITSSNYPRYEKNHNVGLIGSNSGKISIATNHVYFGGDCPSCILLPVVQ